MDYQKPIKGLKPLYKPMYYKPIRKTKEEIKKEKIIFIGSVVIITTVCVIGISSIVYFLSIY